MGGGAGDAVESPGGGTGSGCGECEPGPGTCASEEERRCLGDEDDATGRCVESVMSIGGGRGPLGAPNLSGTTADAPDVDKTTRSSSCSCGPKWASRIDNRLEFRLIFANHRRIAEDGIGEPTASEKELLP